VRWQCRGVKHSESARVDPDGGLSEYTDQTGIENAIWDNIRHWQFYLAEEVPICQSPLQEEFGYCARTAVGRAVLVGKYEYPKQTDPATRELLEEIAEVQQVIPADTLSSMVAGQQWSEYWSHTREETSSLESGLHIGHQIASATSPLLSHLRATRCLIALC
jgi:hypothetical protein